MTRLFSFLIACVPLMCFTVSTQTANAQNQASAVGDWIWHSEKKANPVFLRATLMVDGSVKSASVAASGDNEFCAVRER